MLLVNCGCGYYNSLLIRLQQNFRFPLAAISFPLDTVERDAHESVSHELQQWGKAAAFKILIYLGDLSEQMQTPLLPYFSSLLRCTLRNVHAGCI